MADHYSGAGGGGGGGSGTVQSITAGAGLSGGTITTSGTIAVLPITVNIGGDFSGGGSALVAPQTAFVYVPYAGTITAATLIADQTGSCVVDVWKVPLASVPATSANSIAASDLPTLSNQIEETDNTLTGWTTTINAGDVIYFHLNSATTVTQLSINLSVSRAA
jgi:hypothetical protein